MTTFDKDLLPHLRDLKTSRGRVYAEGERQDEE
jgi:hypothetical protein